MKHFYFLFFLLFAGAITAQTEAETIDSILSIICDQVPSDYLLIDELSERYNTSKDKVQIAICAMAVVPENIEVFIGSNSYFLEMYNIEGIESFSAKVDTVWTVPFDSNFKRVQID